MTSDQVKWAKEQLWFREYREIGNNITPIYKVRISDGGLLLWFSDYNELVKHLKKMELNL